MNYIHELNAFYDWLLTNCLTSSDINLWYALMHIANKSGWRSEFAVAASTLEAKTSMNKKAIERARNHLAQLGRLEWRSRKGNQSALYKLIPFRDYTTPQNDPQSVAQDGAQSPPENVARQNTIQNVAQAVPQNDPQSVAQGGAQGSLKNSVGQNTIQNVAQAVTQNDPQSVAQSGAQCVAINKLKETRLDETKPTLACGGEKIKYAELVLMTKDEHDKLVMKIEKEGAKWCIEKLNNYKASSGKSYESDYHAILDWVVNRWEEEKVKKRNSAARRTSAAQRTSKLDTSLFNSFIPLD